MMQFGLNYLLQFSKIHKGEKIGDLEAIDFQIRGNGSQMGHLMIDCKCHRCNRQFQVLASELNWKIKKFQKGCLNSLDCTSVSRNEVANSSPGPSNK